jgi:hypothetical protein
MHVGGLYTGGGGGGGLLYIRRFTVREVGIVTNINVIRSYFLVFFTSSSFVVVCPVLFCLWVSAFTLCVYSASTFFYTNGPGELVHVTEKGGLIPQQSIGIKVHVYCWPVAPALQLYNLRRCPLKKGHFSLRSGTRTLWNNGETLNYRFFRPNAKLIRYFVRTRTVKSSQFSWKNRLTISCVRPNLKVLRTLFQA